MRLLWWLQDHRGGIAASVAVAAAAAAVYFLVLPDGEGGEGLEMDAEAAQEAFEAAQSGQYGQGIDGAPDIEVEKTPARSVAKADAAGGQGRGTESKQAPELLEPAPCAAGIASGSVVVVSTTGVPCEAASPLVDANESGPVGRSHVGGFACTYSEVGLQVTCARPRDAATVTLLFGPGGPGLEDCQVVPVGQHAITVRVRADGIACDQARTAVFRYFEGGRQGPGGYSCRERETVGVPTVRCTRETVEIAFTTPTAAPSE